LRYEHSDSPFLVEQTLFDEFVYSLSRGRRVYPLEGGEFIGGWHLTFFGQDAREDVVLDQLSDLHENWF